jgi:hypothetical protein
VALDHVLEFQVLVPWHKREAAIPPANPQVVGDAHGEALGAGVPAAFAAQVELVNVGSALPKEVLVLGLPPARPTSVCVIEQLNVLGFDEEGEPIVGRTGGPLRVAEPELAREPRTPGAGRQRSSAQARRLDQLRSEFQLASRPKQVRMALAVIPQMRFRIHGSLLPPSGRGGGRGSSGRP